MSINGKLLLLVSSLALVSLNAFSADRKVAQDGDAEHMPEGVLGMPVLPHNPAHPIMGLPILAKHEMTCTTAPSATGGTTSITVSLEQAAGTNVNVHEVVQGGMAHFISNRDFMAKFTMPSEHVYTWVNKAEGFTMYVSGVSTVSSSVKGGHLTEKIAGNHYLTEPLTCTISTTK